MLPVLLAKEAVTLAWLSAHSLLLVTSNQIQFTRCFYLIHHHFLRQHWDQPFRTRVPPSSATKWPGRGARSPFCSLHITRRKGAEGMCHPAQASWQRGSLGAADTAAPDSWWGPKASVWPLQGPKVHRSAMQGGIKPANINHNRQQVILVTSFLFTDDNRILGISFNQAPNNYRINSSCKKFHPKFRAQELFLGSTTLSALGKLRSVVWLPEISSVIQNPKERFV